MTKIVVVKQDDPEEPVVHRIGNWYEYCRGLYVLMETGSCRAGLISINTGILFTSDSCKVVDIYEITNEEFAEIASGLDDFKYVDRVKIEKV